MTGVSGGRGGSAAFRAARDFLRRHRLDCDTAYRDFTWPDLGEFNWALDWFDVLADEPESVGSPALRIVEEGGSERRLTFAELSARSSQVANWLRTRGVGRGDRMIVMLGNQVELWETILAGIKLGAVLVPASTLLTTADLRDRIDRGDVAHVVTRAAERCGLCRPGFPARLACHACRHVDGCQHGGLKLVALA